MTAPKPAPSKPLTFTPPQFLKGETQSSELPTLEKDTKLKVISSKKEPKNKGHRPNVVIFDEAAAMAGEAVKNFNDTMDVEKIISEKPKKPFVLDPHLTQRPFHDDRLMQLKNRLQRPSFKNR